MDKDQVAVLALVVSLIALFWQPVKHRLDGARVRVRLLPGMLYPAVGSLSHANSWKNLAKWGGDRQGWTVEVAILEIENPGRVGVTISTPSIDFGRTKWWKPGRSSVSPSLLEAPGASTDSVHRLQPFDKVTFVFDFWPLLEGESLGRPDRPFHVRGSVRLAGKRWPQLSSWRTRWLIDTGMVSLSPQPLNAKMAAYRALWRHAKYLNESCLNLCCAKAANAIGEQFPLSGHAPNDEQISRVLTNWHRGDEMTESAHALIGAYAAEDLRHHYAGIDDSQPTSPGFAD